jgi:hypothetical protein
MRSWGLAARSTAAFSRASAAENAGTIARAPLRSATEIVTLARIASMTITSQPASASGVV